MTANTERRSTQRAPRESRHRAREAAVQMLYQWEVGTASMSEVRQTFWTRPGVERDADRAAPRLCHRARGRRHGAGGRDRSGHRRGGRALAHRADERDGSADPAAGRLRVPPRGRDARARSSSTRRWSSPAPSATTTRCVSSTGSSTRSAGGSNANEHDPGIRSGAPAARQPRGAARARRRRLSAPLRSGGHDRRRRVGSWREDGAELEAAQITTRTAGRILAMRSFGKANFLVLSDGKARIQVYIRQDALSGARLPDLQAARFRRLGRRRGAAVPHQDERVHHLGVEARVPRQVPAAAAGEVARPDRRRDPLSPALSRPDRQSRFATGLRGAKPRDHRDPRVPDRPRLSSRSRRR